MSPLEPPPGWQAPETGLAVAPARRACWTAAVLPLLFAEHVRWPVRHVPLPPAVQCKDRLKEWETRGRDAWLAASQRLIAEATGGDA